MGISGATPPAQRTFQKFNPATGALIKEYPVADSVAVNARVESARNTLPLWRDTTLALRSAIFKDVVTLIRQHVDSLAKLISQETGKPVKEALEADINPAIGVLSYYARHGPDVLKEKRLKADKSLVMGRVHVTRHEPKGIVGIISPWNYPLGIPASGLAAALMGGNTAILKPSELTPATGEALVGFFQQAFEKRGLPKDIAQVAIGDGSTGEALVNSDIDYAIFTGSAKTGEKIRDTMAARNKSVSLELGGSDPMLVLDGADLDAVTSYALWGRYTNSGQTCAAVKRLYVPQKDYEQVLELLKNKIEQLKLQPLISEKQQQLIDAQVKDAVEQGARVVTGGKTLPGTGWYYAPTLLADVPNHARVLNEEVFGPVLPVVAYDTVDNAIAMANGLPFGLTASVFGPRQKANAVARQLQAGCVLVNDVGPTNYALPGVPWRGWKSSGPGVSHSAQALLDATQEQTVTENWLYQLPMFRKQPWHYDREPSESTEFSHALVDTFASESWADKLNPRLWVGVLKNRSSKKL